MESPSAVKVAWVCIVGFTATSGVAATVSLTSDVSAVTVGGTINFTVTVTPGDYVSKVTLTYEGESGYDEDTTYPWEFSHQFNTPMVDLTVTATVEYNNNDPNGQDTLDIDVVGLQITGSATPLRGWPTTYQAQSDPAGLAIDQFDWTYAWTGGSNTYQDLDLDGNDKSNWSGKMVVNGTLACSATVAGVSVQKTLAINVRTRGWSVAVACAQDNESTWGDEPEIGVALGMNRDYDSNKTEYIFVPQSTGNDFSGARTLAQVTTGPCTGWWYVSSTTLKSQRETVINRYIKNGGPLPSGASENFYDINDSACFAPYYSSADFALAVAHHEYRGTPEAFKSVEGHQGRIEKSVFDSGHDAKAAIESLTSRSSTALAEAVDDVIAYHQDEVSDYALDESYMAAYGPNWGTDPEALGWGSNSRWDSVAQSWTDCSNGPDDF